MGKQVNHMCKGPNDQLTVLHLVGSPVSEFYYNLSVMYARICDSEPLLDRKRFSFRFAVVQPGGSWCFPESLEQDAIDAAPKMTKPDGIAKLASESAQLDLVVPHMFCYPGMTSYRGLFELLGVPHVGCSAACMAMTTDKEQTKGVMAAAGVNVPGGQLLSRGEEPAPGTRFPVVLKPAREDNSNGIVLVKTREDFGDAMEHALQYDSKIICEDYIAGREVRCAMLEEDDGSLTILPMTEYF